MFLLSSLSNMINDSASPWVGGQRVVGWSVVPFSQDSQENICCRVSFLIKLRAWGLWHRCFPTNFVKLSRAPILKNIFEWLLLTAIVLHVEIKLQRFTLVLFFFSFLWTYKGNIMRRTSVGSKIQVQRTRLNFQTEHTNMVMWNLQIKILYILGHTDNDKDRLQHPEQQIWLRNTISERFS